MSADEKSLQGILCKRTCAITLTNLRMGSGPQRSSTNPYEEKKMVDEYMAFHYCPADEYLQYKFGPTDACDFPKRCAELCLKHKPVSLSIVHQIVVCW